MDFQLSAQHTIGDLKNTVSMDESVFIGQTYDLRLVDHMDSKEAYIVFHHLDPRALI